MECKISIGRMFTILMDLTSCVRESMNLSKDKSIEVNSTALINLIEILQHLVRLVVIRMMISPSEERERASNSASALISGRRAREEAANLKEMLEVMRIKQRIAINEIEDEIEVERSLLEKTKSQQKEEIYCRIDKLKEQSYRIENETILKKKQMEKKIEANEIEAQSTCDSNIMCERELDVARRQVEHHYFEMLAKYDRDVGELHRTMESLMEETNSLLKKLEKLEETLALQETVYDKLKTERETTIRGAFFKNLTNFIRNRAAKVIQRVWRSYWERQQLRKKKKGKKKRQ